MRKHPGMPRALLLIVMLILSACGNGSESAAESEAPESQAAESEAPSSEGAEPSAAESEAPTGLAACGDPDTGEDWLIGGVTDVGQLEDKSFNEGGWCGTIAGATAVNGHAEVIVTEDPADYQNNIQTFIDQGYQIIVTYGFALGSDTAVAAKANPDVSFIGLDQSICVDENGDPDPTFACAGDAATLLPNYQGIVFAEEQAGYLAGIVAASLSESGTIGAVGGTNVPAVVAYNAGYVAGAKSINPDIETLYQETNPDPAKGFNDPATGKAIAQQFIGNGADVLFQIAGLTGQGVIEAACDADILAIGVDVDQVGTLPNLAQCIVTSAEKKLKETVKAAVLSKAADTFQAGTVVYNAASDPPAIGLAPYHELESLITPDIQAKIDEALEAMKDGSLKPPRS